MAMQKEQRQINIGGVYMMTLKPIGYGNPRRLLDQKEVAEILCVSPRTLERWRWKDLGPRYVKVGSLVRYRECDVQDYIEQLVNGYKVI
jgi:predicted DNA-binding transcriptional regulator AlpA